MKKGKSGIFTGWLDRQQLLPLLYALAALTVVVWVRVRLLQTPLERDEGEYAYAGQLIMHGFPPYLHAFSMKLPGMFYLNAAMLKIFGESVSGIHLGLLVANLVSSILVYLIGRRLFTRGAGLISAALFALMTVSQHLLGTFAHATHFVVLFVLAALSLIIPEQKSVSPYRYLVAGIFFGLAFLVKQHAVLFLAAAVLFVMLESRPLSLAAGGAITMATGFAVPCLLTALLAFLQGTFARFWLWTVKYAASYASDLTPLFGWINFRSQMGEILGSMLIYWLLALAGLLTVLFGSSGKTRNFLLPLLLCSFLAICPGFHFRPHYFILVVPVVALLAGALFATARMPRMLQTGLYLLLIGATLFQFWTEGWFLFGAPPEEYVKKAYQTTKPFAESVGVARYVRDNTGPKDRILVLGSEPQIYFYAQRLSATGHIYMYPLMEEQPYAETMQAEML
ncbi:MAG TPA: glycosyltransferase family 39 protein, partial [Geobacteraceae bacterium]|nr:glycosyltransferase family 39 protein [Geobacteraceae bacterium]